MIYQEKKFICKANQSSGFYTIQVFTERQFRTDYNQTETTFSVLAY